MRPIPAGKLPAALLRELLASLPEPPPEVRLGPRVGEDACAIDLPARMRPETLARHGAVARYVRAV